MDQADLLGKLVSLFDSEQVRYCVIGGQAVNAYVDPLVSLDLDLVVATQDLTRLEPVLAQRFRVETFPHSLNVSVSGSDLRVQLQLDPRYTDFLQRASVKPVLGIELPVAHVDDVLQGKIWAAGDPKRRRSKRQKDLADIARILEGYPHLRGRVPVSILERLV